MVIKIMVITRERKNLGNMDNSGRVGNISASSGVSSGNSWDGGISKSDGGQGSRWADLGGSSGNWGSGIGDWGSIWVSSIAIAVWVSSISSIGRVGTIGAGIWVSSIGSIESIGISLSLGLSLGNMDNSGRVGNISASTS